MRVGILIFVLGIWLISTEAKTYHIMKILKLDWHSAFRDCQTRGLQLATINSAEEQADLDAAIKKAGATSSMLWISGTDEGNEGNFAWMTTGLGITYSKFSAGQPDNFGGRENCLHIWFRENALKWNDSVCGSKMFYICEDKPVIACEPINVIISS